MAITKFFNSRLQIEYSNPCCLGQIFQCSTRWPSLTWGTRFSIKKIREKYVSYHKNQN